jgi:hypothetical protein
MPSNAISGFWPDISKPHSQKLRFLGEKAGLSMAAGNFVVFHIRRTIQKSLLHGKELLR